MKKRYVFNLVFIFFVISNFIGKAQNPASSFRDLIIQVPGIHHDRGFPEIKNKLIAIDGVEVITFCQKQQIILMKVDETKLADNKIILDAIHDLNFDFYVKQDATIEKALSTCTANEKPIDNIQKQ